MEKLHTVGAAAIGNENNNQEKKIKAVIPDVLLPQRK